MNSATRMNCRAFTDDGKKAPASERRCVEAGRARKPLLTHRGLGRGGILTHQLMRDAACHLVSPRRPLCRARRTRLSPPCRLQRRRRRKLLFGRLAQLRLTSKCVVVVCVAASRVLLLTKCAILRHHLLLLPQLPQTLRDALLLAALRRQAAVSRLSTHPRPQKRASVKTRLTLVATRLVVRCNHGPYAATPTPYASSKFPPPARARPSRNEGVPLLPTAPCIVD
jgi:hypothetical protein